MLLRAPGLTHLDTMPSPGREPISEHLHALASASQRGAMASPLQHLSFASAKSGVSPNMKSGPLCKELFTTCRDLHLLFIVHIGANCPRYHRRSVPKPQMKSALSIPRLGLAVWRSGEGNLEWLRPHSSCQIVSQTVQLFFENFCSSSG